jgi:hypothetical protein
MTDRNPFTDASRGVRIGDRDRADVANRLSAHAAAGRLGIDELEERLEWAGAAVFARDLDALEADLPGPLGPRPTGHVGLPDLRAPWKPPVALLAGLLTAAAVAATVATGHLIVPLFLVAWFAWRRGAYPAPRRWLS